MTTDVTDFQRSLRSELDAMFQSFSRNFAWTTEGEAETFYHGVSNEGRWQIWIYDDEAECRFDGFHRICERPDFDSLEQLRSYFLETVRAKLVEKDVAPG